MNKLRTKKFAKQIIYIITILMLCNFIMPNITYAKLEDGDGGDLLDGIAQFLCFVPDKVIEFLQDMLVNKNGIMITKNNYSIKYSPAIIFSGEVPAFDINFITPNSQEKSIYSYDEYVKKVLKNSYNTAKALNNYDDAEYRKIKKQANVLCVQEIITLSNGSSSTTNDNLPAHSSGAMASAPGHNGDSTGSTITGIATAYYWADETNGKLMIACSYPTLAGGSYYLGGPTGQPIYYTTSTNLNDSEVQAAKAEIQSYQSTAAILQPTIATWYNALRRIALVGLLSALIYIGIRIVLSSASAKDKAKYKKMLKDWFIALCILFTLHYIMSITVTVVDKINDVIKASSIAANGEDILMSTLRNEIANGEEWGEVIVQVVMYFVLGIYTIIFTIQYFRRTIYLAFLTMIAPLITLTYPLDKIKDNKSQAFDMWIKDYIFFVLLQIVHLLIYYILISSSLNLEKQGNWVFALVAIGFMVPAENLIKKMFGFEKSKTMGAIAAGATGALVMNAINKFSNVAPKGGKTAEGGIGEAKTLAGKYAGKAGSAVLRAGLGGTGAIIGLAAGISQGDLGAAGAGLIAGGKAGNAVGKRLSQTAKTGTITKSINNIKDTWNEGAFGADFAQSASAAREFKRSSEYKGLIDKYGDRLTDENLRAMIGAGITDKDSIAAILDSGTSIDNAIKYYTVAKNCPPEIFYDKKMLKNFCEGLRTKDEAFQGQSYGKIRDMMKKFM